MVKRIVTGCWLFRLYDKLLPLSHSTITSDSQYGEKNIHLSDLSWSQQIWGKITNFTAFFKHCGLKRILPKHERASHVIRSRIGGMLQSASYVHTKTTPRNVGGIKRLEYFYSEHHILRGDLCKSGPRHFASEKKFSLKLCPINYLW